MLNEVIDPSFPIDFDDNYVIVMSTQTGSTDISALNGMRGFAALLVICSHTSLREMYFLPNIDLSGIGKSGVFLFFILSSFLLIRQFNFNGRSSFSPIALALYFKKRFFRIFPFYTLYLALAFLSTLALSLVGIQERGIPFELSYVEFIKHIFLLEGKGVTWSIAVEFKFYFFLPVISFLIFKVRAYDCLFPYFFIGLLMLCFVFLFPQYESLENDSRLFPYFQVFLFGALLAELQHKKSGLSSIGIISTQLLSLLGIAGLIIQVPSVYSMFVQVEADYFSKNFFQQSLCWFSIMYCVLNSKGILTKFFEIRILQIFGALSFSIYLIHPIMIGVIAHANVEPVFSAWLVLLLSFITSYLSYKFIELPGMRLVKK